VDLGYQLPAKNNSARPNRIFGNNLITSRRIALSTLAIDSLGSTPLMAPVAAKTWPIMGVKDVDRRLHSRILL